MTQKCDFRTHFPVQGVCMSAHYCLVTVWSQSGSSREGKGRVPFSSGCSYDMEKSISSFVGCADVLTRAAGAIG